MGFVGDMFGGGGSDAGDASIAASNIQADYQREALDYLKEREQVPQQYRESALGQMAGAYGIEGGQGSQQDIINRAEASPLYASIMGGQQAGEEAIMRNASMTGGLRSGNVSSALAQDAEARQNNALLQSYNQQMQGMGGLAQLPSLAPQIAQGTTGIGQTLAQGQIASAQAGQAGQQQGFGNMMGLGQLGLQAYGSGMF